MKSSFLWKIDDEIIATRRLEFNRAINKYAKTECAHP